MKILSFEFRDADSWTLEPMKLDACNLLVGVSGAGKTRIVRAIERVCAVALGTADAGAGGARFAIEFEHEGHDYRWEAELKAEDDASLIHRERITQGDRVIVDRTAERFRFDGGDIPRVDRARSAFVTLKEEPSIAPLYAAFSRCFFMESVMVLEGSSYKFDAADLEKQRRKYRTAFDVGADLTLPLQHKAFLLSELFPNAFATIDAEFRGAFPSVQRIEATRVPLEAGRGWFAVLVENESEVADPVSFWEMSSGMQRYLSFLIHLSFAPPGTVVLVDELESSFGINCLPAATDFLLGRAPDLQLVLTSHHPYIIEEIPVDSWKIVTRKGSHVRVLDASTIPALEESRSHLDRFTRLINLPEYRRGVQAA